MTQHTVGIADLTAGAGDITLVTIGLGSCVAIALHDRAHRVGALAHVLLPHHALTADTPSAGKAASTAVPAMLSRMHALGATRDIEARLVGGAISLGARNVQAARAACAAHDIPIVGEAVGGDFGRSVYFDVSTGRLHVRTVRGDDVHL